MNFTTLGALPSLTQQLRLVEWQCWATHSHFRTTPQGIDATILFPSPSFPTLGQAGSQAQPPLPSPCSAFLGKAHGLRDRRRKAGKERWLFYLGLLFADLEEGHLRVSGFLLKKKRQKPSSLQFSWRDRRTGGREMEDRKRKRVTKGERRGCLEGGGRAGTRGLWATVCPWVASGQQSAHSFHMSPP